MSEPAKVRIDKWLWAVRLFKTRKLAHDACLGGKVKMDNSRIKPARLIQVGDVITVRRGPINGIYKVKGLIEKRVSATLAAANFSDLTPPEEILKLETAFAKPVNTRERGAGRPTKRERRLMDKSRGKF